MTAAGMLRFDGLYRSSVRERGGKHPYRTYLRFYADGCVIDQSITEPASVMEILRWFERDRTGASQGVYRVENQSIRFHTTLEFGMDRDGTTYPPVRVEYEGVVGPDRLILHWWTDNKPIAPDEEFKFSAAR